VLPGRPEARGIEVFGGVEVRSDRGALAFGGVEPAAPLTSSEPNCLITCSHKHTSAYPSIP